MKKVILTVLLLVVLTFPTYAALDGKVILLNPGHGGGERGAIGPDGLQENTINLKIGLYLRDMLEEAGATVYMTRTGDYDLDGTGHYSGTRDRFNRLRTGRAKEADIFVALHHNASVNSTAEQIEVYYMPNYYGPSKDLAEFVVGGLKAEMELGGYATTMSQLVLNHATIPTIIGEASYISNPEMEEWFRKDENLRKVAQGYFNGIQRFFDSGMPKITPFTPDINEKVNSEKPKVIAKISKDGNSDINPASIRVFLDKQIIPHKFDQKTGLITAQLDQPLTNDEHRLLIIGANKDGISAIPADYRFYIDDKPDAIHLDSYPTYVPANESRIKISGKVVDDDGQPIMDGNKVYFEIDGGYLEQDWTFTRDGRFINHLRHDGNSKIAAIRVWAGDQLEEIVVDFRSDDAFLSGKVDNTLVNSGIKDIKVVLSNKLDSYTTKTDAEGHYYFSELQPGTYQLEINRPGFQDYHEKIRLEGNKVTQRNIGLAPVANGILHDRKIILNTVVDGSISQPNTIVNSLKERLVKAGAEIEVISSGSSEIKTVKQANKLFGELILSIKVSQTNYGTIYHYPRSDKYKKMADKLEIKGLKVSKDGSKSRLVTFANTDSFIVEVPIEYEQDKISDGLYQFILDYFKTVEK